MNKKLNNKTNKNGKLSPKAFVLIVVLAFIAIAAIIAVPIIVHNLTYEPQLSDIKTDFDNYTLTVRHKGECGREKEYELILINNTENVAKFRDVLSPDLEDSEIIRYYVPSEGKYYQKYLAGRWNYNTLVSRFVMPNERIRETLSFMRDSHGKKLSNKNGLFIYGVYDPVQEEKVYENVNDIMALGNDFGSGKFESIKAKIFLQRSGEVSKIIFYPKGAGKTEGFQVDSDYIQDCDEVIWEFSDINKTTLNYKNDLWEYL